MSLSDTGTLHFSVCMLYTEYKMVDVKLYKESILNFWMHIYININKET